MVLVSVTRLCPALTFQGPAGRGGVSANTQKALLWDDGLGPGPDCAPPHRSWLLMTPSAPPVLL